MKRLAFLLCLGLTACTVTPKILPPAEQPSWDGNVQNSGLIRFSDDGSAVITPHARDRYNTLIDTYGKRFTPALHPDDGVTRLPDGTYSITAQHLSYFAQMNNWKRSGL